MDLILFGIQGSGKGTQAKILAQKYNYKIFETGAELRSIAKSHSALGQKVKSIMEAGNLVDTSIIMEIVAEFIKQIPKEEAVIFDGIPRSLEQMEQFEILMTQLGRSPTGLNVKLSADDALERLLNRFICEGVDTTNNPLITEAECVALGGKIVRRNDDNKKAIQVRINAFVTETQPVINKYRKLKRLFEVEGNQTVETVSSEIMQMIEVGE
jgi:adenylate kinase